MSQVHTLDALPQYRCHKVVRAMQITRIDGQVEGGARLVGSDHTVYVDAKFVAQHMPQVGGYFVLYGDGYKSYSPKQAFEEGYTLITE